MNVWFLISFHKAHGFNFTRMQKYNIDRMKLLRPCNTVSGVPLNQVYVITGTVQPECDLFFLGSFEHVSQMTISKRTFTLSTVFRFAQNLSLVPRIVVQYFFSPQIQPLPKRNDK